MKKKTSLTWGNYYPVDSIIHRLDPRCKFILSFIFLIVVFFAKNIWMYAALYGFTLLIIGLSHVPLKQILRSLRMIIWLAVFTGVLNAFFLQGDIIWQWGFLKLTQQGLVQGAYMICRLILLIGFASILTLTTTPVELTDGMESLMQPLKRFGVPAHELAMMISIALRFIPILMLEVDVITKAQRARGADMRKLGNIVSLIIPLFASALQRAADLALAMESRGYMGGEGRTKYRALQWQGHDTAATAIMLCFCAGIVLWRYLGI